MNRRRYLLVGAAAFAGGAALFFGANCALMMPGNSFSGPLPAIQPAQISLAQQLRGDVEILAGRIGERHTAKPENLAAAEDFLVASLARAGYAVEVQPFDAHGVRCANVAAELRGSTKPEEVIVLGAHYDSAVNCPAANDNASGCAAVLALARHFAGRPQTRTVRFVLFPNEEPPHFWKETMGSLVYASACKARAENIVGMLSLETMGFYSDEQNSQSYPPPVGLAYPSRGTFVGFVGMSSAEDLIKRSVGAFRNTVDFPSEGAALPSLVPMVAASDHWSFWKHGYPALMVTDTAPYRYPHYHKPTDTPDKLDYERMARVVNGLVGVVEGLAGADPTTP
jgi:hypothetical protein